MRKRTDVSSATKVVLLLGVALVASRIAITVCLPQMRADFQGAPHSDFLIKSLVTTTTLFGGITSFFIGFLLDKYGRKKIIIASSLISVIGCVGFIADSLYVILASRIFVGVGAGGALTGFTTLIGDYFEGRRLDKFMGLQTAFLFMGNICFLALGGILADINWRLVFLVYGLPFFAFIAIWLFIEEPTAVKTVEFSKLKEPLPKSLYPIFVLAFLSGLIFCMVYVYTPFYLKSLTNAKTTKISLALISALASGAIAGILYPKFSNHLSFRKILMICFVLISMGFFGVAAADAYYQVVSGLIITGLGFGLFVPTLNILTVSRVSSSNRGRAVGVLKVFFSTGPFFALIILQPIVNKAGISKTFFIIGILPLILMAIFRKIGK